MESILVIYSDILQAKDFVINTLENNNTSLVIGETYIRLGERIYSLIDINDPAIYSYKNTHHPNLIYCTITCTLNHFYNNIIPLVADEFDNIADVINKVRWVENVC